ncbi:hypothetical protein [Spiroplasma endosymbiont of Othius punctulatus]|uniref:MurR/RpiR family transcriptional regulator n=1 Tax=Spiroplasma endosymbiont of Othius punctulatus TaxID=3066289 RepID=UPI0030CC779C
MILDLHKLTEKQLEFYKYSIKNIDNFINMTVKEIAETYGCGISFIYTYFDKLKISGIKDYISKLTIETNSKDNIIKNVLEPSSIDDQLLAINIQQQIDDYNKIKNQVEKINQIKELFYSSKNIYGVAFGHSKLAIEDLIGFYSFVDPKIELTNSETIKKIEPNSVVVFYSVRFVNKKFKQILKQIDEVENVKKILITSSPKKGLASIFDVVFYVNNVMQKQENLNFNYYLGPLNCFIMFNNFLKSEIFKDNKKELLENKMFLKETLGWTDYLIAKDI